MPPPLPIPPYKPNGPHSQYDAYAPAYPIRPGQPDWPYPVFSLRIDNLAHPGASLFLASVDPTEALTSAVRASFVWLYGEVSKAPTNVLSILLVLRSMPGVAYCTGIAPDPNAHKEIHVSLDHLVRSNSSEDPARVRQEILGVLTHEVVHCYQNNCGGSAPGGMIEGIADYVRLREFLCPPHWLPVPNPEKDKWDSGYATTAFFLFWVEERYGDGTIQEINEHMHPDRGAWDEKVFKMVTGRKVEKLWKIYCEGGGGRIPVADDALGFRQEDLNDRPDSHEDELEESVLVDRVDALEM